MATKRMEALLTRSRTEKTRGRVSNLHWETFHLDLGKKFFTVRAIIHWNNIPRDVGSQTLEVFKMQLDRMLGNLM